MPVLVTAFGVLASYPDQIKEDLGVEEARREGARVFIFYQPSRANSAKAAGIECAQNGVRAAAEPAPSDCELILSPLRENEMTRRTLIATR